jgi:hypothetical protein
VPAVARARGGAGRDRAPGRPLVVRLLDAGLSAVAAHLNQVAAMRPRITAAGGKGDSFDSFVLAKLAPTDSNRYRVLAPTVIRRLGSDLSGVAAVICVPRLARVNPFPARFFNI